MPPHKPLHRIAVKHTEQKSGETVDSNTGASDRADCQRALGQAVLQALGRLDGLHRHRVEPREVHARGDVHRGGDEVLDLAGLVAALLQEDTRPRAARHGKGFLINLRGMNHNEGEDTEDMLSVRMWASENMLITLRARPIQATRDVAAAVEQGEAPNSTGGLIAHLANALTNRMEPEIAGFEEQADAYEDQLLDTNIRLPRSALSEFRRRVLAVRRYILPQRDALAQMLREGSSAGLFNETDLLYLRESADRVTRLSEELDTIRERSTVLQEQIMEERSDLMNQRLFVLSILSAIFLPISFVTGLFGVNIAGMPGMNNPAAFTLLVGGLFLTSVLMLLVFRWRRWI